MNEERKTEVERYAERGRGCAWMIVVVGILIIAWLASGCAPGLYARGGLGYQLDDQTDYWQQTDREWQCSNPTARVEVGYELNDWSGVALVHNSWLLCGSGRNDDPESYANRVEVWAQWGGR